MLQEPVPFIAHIEDDDGVRRAWGRMLRELTVGSSVVLRRAATVAAGDALLASPEALPCGFLVDHILPDHGGAKPGPHGLEYAVRLRRHYPRAPVVLVTGVFEPRLAVECAAADVRFLPKAVRDEQPLVPFAREAVALAERVRWRDLAVFTDAVDATNREIAVLRLAARGRCRRETSAAT